MTKKITILVSMILSIILISGCSSQTSDNIPIDDPYLGGTEGLVIEFEELGTPIKGVQTIYDDEEFSVNLKIKNKGEFTIAPGLIKSKLQGISPNDYTGISFEVTNNDELEKISDFNDNGGEINLNHGNGKLVNSRIKDRNLLPVTIYSQITFPYKTFVSAPKVCFKDTTSKNRDDRICEVQSSLQVFSSGGPIKVVSAEEVRSGKGLISVIFVIENVGGGETKKPSNLEFDYKYDEIGYVVQESSDPNKWRCTNSGREGVGRFRDDKTLEILCKLKDEFRIQPDDVYQAQLDLTLEYDYRKLVSGEMIIRNKDS